MNRNEHSKTERELSMAIAVNKFSEFLKQFSSLDEIKQKYSELYFDCSQYVMRSQDSYRYDCPTNLHYLIELIELLNMADLEKEGITEDQINQLNNVFYPVEIDDPASTILEISNNRTSQLEELTFIEAKALIDRLNKVNQTHYLTIKQNV